MKIIIAKHSGFCFGVKRAIEMAKKSLRDSTNNVYLIGDIVHNKIVVDELHLLGLKSVENINDVPIGATIILKAHGSHPLIYELAKKRKLKIIDATCPMVTDIHKKAQKLEQQGYQVIVFGDKYHEEVIGICGQIKNPIIVRTIEDAKNAQLKQKVTLVCQSTQKIDEILEVCEVIKKRVKDFHFENTLCETTKLRQKEVKGLAKSSDAVIVVGSKNSANTKHLFEEAKSINERTYWIETKDDIFLLPLRQSDILAIVSGASTPEIIINSIYTSLQI